MAKTIGQLTQTTTIAGGDEFVIEQGGQTKRVAASVVRGDISDTNIANNAGIAFSKLAALDSANILVGNGSNVATKVAVTGDVTISNAGVTAIGSAKVLPAMLSQPYTLATAKAFNWNGSSSNTAIDFESIPSWAKRITVMFDGVSTNGTSRVQIQLGDSGGFETTGYTASSSLAVSANTVIGVAATSGFVMEYSVSGDARTGAITISQMSGNKWVANGVITNNGSSGTAQVAGVKTLSDTLTQVRITTVNGTDTFDAGTINISYEG